MTLSRLGLALALLLVHVSVQTLAAPRRTRPAHRANPQALLHPQEGRAPAPAPQLDQPESDEPLAFVFDWQRRLAQSMPGAVAWGLLAAPFWFPLLLWVVVTRLRRRREDRSDAEGDTAAPPLPRLPEVAPPSLPLLELSAEQTLLLKGTQEPSLHETFVALRVGTESLHAWRHVAQEDLTADLWTALVAGEHSELRRRLRTRWLKRLAFERLEAWLGEHPLVTADKAEAQVPADLEVAALNELCLVGRDGLALTPDTAQDELLRQTRRGLTLAYRGADSPYTLEYVAKQASIPALLLGPKEDLNQPPTHPLALLLHGLPAFERMVATGLFSDGRGQELREQVEEHRKKVGRPLDADGPATHLLAQLPGPEPAGIGMLLASIAGAAFSPATVSLQLSRTLGVIESGPFQVLGRLLAPALADANSVVGQAVQGHLRRLLGEGALRTALERTRELEHAVERQAAKEPLWPTVKAGHAPDVALMQLHRRLVEQATVRVALASARLANILAKVAYAGRQQRDQRIAAGRLGYVMAGLGPGLFEGAEDALAAAAQAAVAAAYRL